MTIVPEGIIEAIAYGLAVIGVMILLMGMLTLAFEGMDSEVK